MSEAIHVGDKFRRNGVVYEVVGTKIGGKVELFDRERCMFTDRWHRDVREWEQVTGPESGV